MKHSLFAVATLVPQFGFALVGNKWSFSGSPRDGLKDITFPFNMHGAAHESGFYVAQQFSFLNISGGGYCGIQNRPNQGGKSIVHAVFSMFHQGTTTNDANCHIGADGGVGVSCAVEVVGNYNTTYNLVVKNVKGTTWTGTIVDTDSGNQTRVGTYTLPSGAGGIKSSQSGFVEYFPWNGGGAPNCAELPKFKADMYQPQSKTCGAGTGSMKNIHQYGKCKGKVNFSSKGVPSGFEIEVGF
ncbi:uncharacterized protein MAM_08186 [Metarhizium album ARSEF 1941]|uniref:Uncharacterized protein n=1 Tax=Metarhizium album (strain ARSEF 1941) TaxID=1081103 RepID=A0A0B2WDI5_METAS|nr:uncharacterized protein MAM_08186 [Metarhizium album ARSEF 1941]KHN93931.1 hypothetical protein MAM_08186 [Metarhizium album ARSEF 1941]